MEFVERDTILQTLEENEPTIILPGGYVRQTLADAVFQSADPGSMSAKFTIVTRTKQPNRNGNQVQIVAGPNGKGILTDAYQKNPVVLYDHGFGGINLPIAQSETPNGEFTVQLAPTKATAVAYFSQLPHSEPVFAAVNEKLLRMASIAYNPIRAALIEQQKQDAMPTGVEACGRYRGLDFCESEMMEWSVTPIGADRGSLRQCLERGKIHDVKLPPWLRQSFSGYAEPKPAMAPGWTAPTPQPEQQAAQPKAPEQTPVAPIEPPPAKPIHPATTVEPPPPAPVIVQHVEPTVDPAEIGNMVAAALQPTVSPEQLTAAVMQSIEKSLGPALDKVRQESKATVDRFSQLTGKPL